MMSMKYSLIAVAVAILLASDWLFPYGPAVKVASEDRISFASVDHSNDSLQAKHGKLQKIYERRSADSTDKPIMKGHETVFFDSNNGMYTFSNGNEKLVRWEQIRPDENDSTRLLASPVVVATDLGNGLPLGASFTKDGSNTLYIADVVLGLTRIRNVGSPEQRNLEVLASGFMDGDSWSTFAFVDDVAIGPRTGKVYFTDATDIAPRRGADLVYDPMYASKINILRGKSAGKLLVYDPKTGEVQVLARDMFFANGVTVDAKESYLLVSETVGLKVMKYYLAGEKEGTYEYILKGPPNTGYIDNIDCSWKGVSANDDLCYGVHLSRIPAAGALLAKIPHPIDMFLRNILLMFPAKLLPKLPPYAAVSIFEGETGKFLGMFQDPDGSSVHHCTGVTVNANKLYLGSLHNDYIAVYNLG